ncbi:hypothetical protein [Paracoccus sp. SCSIO 75233]|uniref:hypothetical protein n=1 Tax=Paracoccus sp. SCSIO 75233 TaxID=3017782 RepID=UPI0022F117FC|nr:hypothetical protein [Paracoccus sp. SCSIO 75233]WBU55214.1 hypothetical protein PAF12_17970 [Paracoccus sp. SCSIO 75233]
MQLEKLCASKNVSFQTVTRWQYVITENASLTDAMDRHAIGPWFVYTGTGVRTAALLDRHGEHFGYLVGIGVDQYGLVQGSYRIDSIDAQSDEFFDSFEEWLYPVSGRYTILIGRDSEWRCYSDPVGMNGVVFDAGERQVASSLALCLNREVICHPLYDHESVTRGELRYSLFHTKDAYAKRGNPNCYLDLRTFSEHRFWPKEEGLGTTSDLIGTYEFLTKRTREIIGVLNKNFSTGLPLSGGQDSRLLLAMSGPEIKNFGQCFTQIHNYAARIDAAIAGKLAEIADIEHLALDRRKIKPTKRQTALAKQEFMVAAGLEIPLPREIMCGLHTGIADGSVVIRGHQTDLLRAVLTDRLGEKGRENLFWQLKRLLVPYGAKTAPELYEQFKPFYENWIATLPRDTLSNQIDLMFTEIFYSSTVGLTFPAFPRYFLMSAFNSRQQIQGAAQIDETYRRSGSAVFDIIFMNSQEIHNFPFDFEYDEAKKLVFFDDEELVTAATRERRENTSARFEKLLREGS